LIGQTLQRLDGPAKADGSWRFAGDVRVPDMLFASVRIAPPGGWLRGYSRDAMARVPGVRHVTARDGWVAVVADNWWAAEKALKSANPIFSGGRSAQDLRPLFDDALANGDPQRWFERGDYDQVTAGSRPLAATYFVAPSQHLGLEPLTATARRADLWAATQAPGKPVTYPMPPGEPAGRAMEADAVPIAAELARALGRPVQVLLSQSASQNQDLASPGALARMIALPGAGGITAAWAMRVAPKVLVSTMSAPARRYASWIASTTSGRVSWSTSPLPFRLFG
jgi:isoquinoline 1-oxidoreductase beta subunit